MQYIMQFIHRNERSYPHNVDNFFVSMDNYYFMIKLCTG